jgi:hypothetical protein
MRTARSPIETRWKRVSAYTGSHEAQETPQTRCRFQGSQGGSNLMQVAMRDEPKRFHHGTKWGKDDALLRLWQEVRVVNETGPTAQLLVFLPVAPPQGVAPR